MTTRNHISVHWGMRFLTAIFFCFFSLALTVTAQQKPNVLFIVVDDLRPALGCYGDTNAVSPNIDRLAAMGTVFTEAYCQQAVCAPSRASFMTGKKPDHTKVWNLNTHFRVALPEVLTMPEYFKQQGYFARQIGKIYHDPEAAQDPRSWSAPAILGVTTNFGKYTLDSNLARAPKANFAEAADVTDSAYIDGKVADAAIRELQAKHNQPFFLAVGFRRPHLPFSVPRKYWSTKQIPLPADTATGLNIPAFSRHNSVELRGYQDIPNLGSLSKELAADVIKGYYTSVTFTDAQVGKLLQELKRLKIDQQTIVVLISDHGFHLGEHGMWGKTTNSRIDTHVPLIIYDPAQKKAPKSSAELVQLLDLYASMADLCGLPAPETDGQSFADILRAKSFHTRGIAFSQFPDDMKFSRQPGVMGYAAHTANFGYTEWLRVETGEVLARELYDYANDPAENINVASDPKFVAQIASFQEQLNTYRK